MKNFLLLIMTMACLVKCQEAYSQVIEGTSARQIEVRRNYIKDGNAELYSKGFVTYADTGAIPTDGIGGSPTIANIVTSTSSPIERTKSFQLTHPSSNVQGQGVSIPFTIDNKDKAKVLDIEIDYQIVSGTFAGSVSPSVLSDVTIYVYDVINAVLITPSSVNIPTNVTATTDKFKVSFQSAINSTSYRLIYHYATTSTSAYVLRMEFGVYPTKFNAGTIVTDWQNGTCTATWTTNTSTVCKYRRVGDTAEINYYLSLTGAPNAVQLLFNPPAGLVFDTTKNAGTGNRYPGGHGQANRGGAAVSLHVNGSVQLEPLYDTNGAVGTGYSEGAITNTLPSTWANGDYINISVIMPVSGWGSSLQLANEADTRVVAAVIQGPGSGSITTGAFTDIIYAAVQQDTHGAFNPATGVYTVVTPGFYQVHASIELNGTGAAGVSEGIRIQKNGGAFTSNTPRQPTAVNNPTAYSTSAIVYLSTTDTVKAQYITGRTSASYSATIVGPSFSISKVSGPSAIAASESVAARYTAATATAIATVETDFNPATRDFDSHNAYTTGTGFTCPSSGKYRAYAQYISQSTSAANQLISRIYRNGSQVTSSAFIVSTGVTGNYTSVHSATVQCDQGSVLKFRRLATTTGLNDTGSAFDNFVEFTKVAN